MQSINNGPVLKYDQNNNNLDAAVNFSYNAGTKELTVTDATVYPAGDDRKALNVTAYDKFGGKKEFQLTGADVDDAVTADLDAAPNALNVTEGVSIIVTLTTNLGKIKDGTVHDIATLKSAGSVTMQK